MLTNSKTILAPEIIEIARQSKSLAKYTDEELAETAHLFAAQAAAIIALPEARLYGAMGAQALMVFMANTYVGTFLGKLAEEGVIDVSAAAKFTAKTMKEFKSRVDDGEKPDEIGNDLWN